MDIGDLVTREGIIPSLKVKSKKLALQELAARAAKLSSLPERDIYDALLQRERLASTGLGRGIAIPHAKFRALKGMICVFARLVEPIEFESLDGEPVDLMFVLLAPEHASGDHLKALARVSRLVRDTAAIERIRSARDAAALYSVLTAPIASHAA